MKSTFLTKISIYLLSLFIITSCSDNKEAQLKSNKDRFISVVKYKPEEKECCKGILLDSISFDFHFCLFKNEIEKDKKVAINDIKTFNFIEGLDTLSLMKLESCTDYKGKWNGYFYEVFFDYGNVSKSIMLRDQELYCENSFIIDSLNNIFSKLD